MLLPLEDLRRHRVNIDFCELTAQPDHLELIHPAVAPALERDADDFPTELGTHPCQNFEKRQRLPTLDRPARLIVIAISP